MPHTILPFMIVFLLTSPIANAEIYKWKDENGKLHYSSTPRVLAPNIQEVKLQKLPADRANANRQERLLNQKKRDIRRVEQDKQNEMRKEKHVQAEQRAMLKQEARNKEICEKYKQRYTRYKNDGVKGINLVTGKKQNLKGAAARNAIQDAKENVGIFCQ